MNEPIHVVVMGVSGSGKTTVAAILQDRLGWEFAEADEFHPQSNVDKMHRGIPLTDEDRWPWLNTIRDWMTDQEKKGKSTIVTCSALKYSYREVLRRGTAPVIFMHLDGDRELLAGRLAARTDHFMPASLLDSQYATLEELRPDELGAVVDIAGSPAEIASAIEDKLARITGTGDVHADDSASAKAFADVGVYGLGVMGSALARNIANHGFTTAVINIDSATTDSFILSHGDDGDFVATKNVKDFVESLQRPRKILLMVTAGPAVDSVIADLLPHLDSGDIVVDMGNSHFPDTRRREVSLLQRGIYFVGCGTSGGESGALTGPALMIGGADAAYTQLRPLMESIGAKTEDGASCAVHVGPGASGHFVKMVHNGIEYADMQLIAEIYHLLHESWGMSNAEIADVFADWNRGELASYLLEISAEILRYSEDGVDFVDLVSDRASHKGTGAWSTMIGVELGVNVSVLSSALFARFASGSKVRAGWPEVISEGGARPAGDVTVEELRQSLLIAKRVAYTQGFELIRAASAEFGWNVDLAQVCLGWRAGCIIRGAMLDEFAEILGQSGHPEDILLAKVKDIERWLPAMRKVVSSATSVGMPVLAMGVSLSFVEESRAKRLPTALIQAQRDFFGAHGFERVDREGVGFHGPWHSD
ncbi:MAG: NADP-dependent phosphogluconate dehydrogenase [Gleimia sp.]|jgi:6-phosphogluconate dehydrogenase